MEKLKTLFIVLIFLLFISVVLSFGVYSLVGLEYFIISLGTSFVASSLFILFQFIVIILESNRK
ncbi:hypothetical protein NG767_03045 [Aliarcobacter cryaerophilus]|uniref:hypothetical protein n=1 Tax=Aliarcobacter cryaerophilus TaxID=28198 RepID=UPI003DA1D995